MDTTIEELLGPRMGEDVLNVLMRHAGPLPSEGFVAGQAVASAIDELLGTGRPVYNDFDVFVDSDQWTAQTGEPVAKQRDYRHLVASRVNYYAEEAITGDEYAHTVNVASRDLYSVRESRTDGMTNRVLVDWAWGLRQAEPKKRAEGLIRVFDANNVQVAVDLKTGELYRTKAYEQFLASRELRLTQSFTPVHSLLRYLKKREELGVFGNDAAHIDLAQRLLQVNELSVELRERRKEDFAAGYRFFDLKFLPEYVKRDRVAYQLMGSYYERLGTGVRQMPLAFGTKYKALYDRFADKLAPYFTLTERKNGKLWLVSSRADTVDTASAASHLTPCATTARTTGEHVVRRYWQLALPAGKQLSRRRTLFEGFLAQLTEEGTRNAYIAAHNLVGDTYLEGCDSVMGLNELASVVNEHHEFTWAAITHGVGLQIALMRLLRKTFKVFGVPDAWGICRDQSPETLKRWLVDDTSLRSQVQVLLGTKEPLYGQRLPMPASLDGIEVHELDNAYALRVEGGKMHHCVSGYAGSVSTEGCRIISLRKGTSTQDWATVEWNFREEKTLPFFEKGTERPIHPLQLSCGQIRSFANSTPGDDLQALEVKLRGELNAWLAANPEEGWQVLMPKTLGIRRDPAQAAANPKASKFLGRALQARPQAQEIDEAMPF